MIGFKPVVNTEFKIIYDNINIDKKHIFDILILQELDLVEFYIDLNHIYKGQLLVKDVRFSSIDMYKDSKDYKIEVIYEILDIEKNVKPSKQSV